ncbi:hypothetical protein PR048_020928 [Dryococelus australis]|uniref:HAT C-terminal dimerisation domain-containing protein n=1 Tax=Dryococelus australis TaxID=614101 RepID=A0ABQ9GWS4_9NEOP|nr:hypothetical protein PR048_020928 [Dryococelus australis]
MQFVMTWLGSLFKPREVILNAVCHDLVNAGKLIAFQIVSDKMKRSENGVDIVQLLLSLKLDHTTVVCNVLKTVWIPISNVYSDRALSTHSDVFSDKRRSLKPENVETMVSLYFNNKI